MSTHRHWSHSKSFQHTVPCNIHQTPDPSLTNRLQIPFMGTKNDEVLFQDYCGAFLRFIQSLSFSDIILVALSHPFPSFPIHNVACVLALESLHKSCHRTALGPAIRDRRLRRFCRFAVYAFCIPRGTALSFLMRTCKSVFGRPSSTEILGDKTRQTCKQRSKQGEMEASSICKATGTYRISGRERPHIAG